MGQLHTVRTYFEKQLTVNFFTETYNYNFCGKTNVNTYIIITLK